MDSSALEAFQIFGIEFPTISNLDETMCAYFACFETREAENYTPLMDVMVILCENRMLIFC